MFYSAQTKSDIISIVQKFNRDTMVIPPSEWNPKIRIEPPEKFLSKVKIVYINVHNSQLFIKLLEGRAY